MRRVKEKLTCHGQFDQKLSSLHPCLIDAELAKAINLLPAPPKSKETICSSESQQPFPNFTASNRNYNLRIDKYQSLKQTYHDFIISFVSIKAQK